MIFHRPRMRMVYGKPFVLNAAPVRRSDIEEGTEHIMHEIAALIPAEYRGVYRDRFPDLPESASVDVTEERSAMPSPEGRTEGTRHGNS